MLFSSSVFLFAYLPIVLAVYYIPLRGLRRAQNFFLLVASLLFYAWGEPWFVLVMAASIAANYGFGLWVHARLCRRRSVRLPVTAAAACNLGLLFSFKYLTFTLTNLGRLGFAVPAPVIGLPIGISFFTFQAMSYVFDVARGKTRVQRSISRGKVDVFVSIDSSKADSVSVSVNRPVADGYYAALTELRDVYGLQDDLSVSLLSRLQDVLLVEKAQEDVETVAADIGHVLDLALADFSAMREREGQKLREDILSRAETIGRLTSFVEEQSPKTVSEYRARLEAKMRDVLQNTQIDESRILTEAAIFADKVAVDEETVRLRSHLSQLREMLELDVPVGRKLDFLIQEFNREANTIGSKCNDIETSKKVIDIKAEIEKIREQIQNLE